MNLSPGLVRRAVRCLAAAAAIGCALAPRIAQAEPAVVVSIKPLHSLVAGVMRGVAEPYLLMSGATSPHTYHLTPSAARRVREARMVFWVGDSLEGFMPRVLAALAQDARAVAVVHAPGAGVLARRLAGDWGGHAHDHEPADTGDAHEHAAAPGQAPAPAHPAGIDPHLWLDPENAIAIVRHAADELASLDPDNAVRYRRNAAHTEQRLRALDDELDRRLAPLRQRPFAVFHDAWQYLEARYRLRSVGAVSLSPERTPGAAQVAAVRERLRRLGAVCLFSEPQFQPRLVRSLVLDTGVRSGELDPLGAALAPGPEMYFELQLANARALEACLAGGS